MLLYGMVHVCMTAILCYPCEWVLLFCTYVLVQVLVVCKHVIVHCRVIFCVASYRLPILSYPTQVSARRREEKIQSIWKSEEERRSQGREKGQVVILSANNICIYIHSNVDLPSLIACACFCMTHSTVCFSTFSTLLHFVLTPYSN